MSSEATLSPIEMKKNNSSDMNKNNKKKNDLLLFTKSVFMNFIYAILFGIIGSNVLYISLIPGTLFSTNPNDLPYTSGGLKGGSSNRTFSNSLKQTMKGGGIGDNLCGFTSQDVLDSKKAMEFILEKTKSNTFGFPYNLIKTPPDGMFQIIKNLFGESSKYSYVTCRKLITTIIKMFEGSENWLFMLSVPVLWGLLLFFVPFFLGSFLTYISFIGEYFYLMSNKYGWIFTIFFTLFIGILIIFLGLFWSGAVGFVQMIRLYGTFLLLPILKDTKHVLKIFNCKSHIIISLFVILTTLSCFTHLDIIPAVITSLVLIYLSYHYIIDMFKKK
jgi:hypothetical protein